MKKVLVLTACMTLLVLTACVNSKLDNTIDVASTSNTESETKVDKDSKVLAENLSENPITSEDIANIAKELNLNNYGNVSADLATENIIITYDNDCNITRCSNRTNKFYNRSESLKERNISNLDIFTEYGNNELGYNTLTHIEFISDLSTFQMLKPYIVKVTYPEIGKLIDKNYDTKEIISTINFNNGIIKIDEDYTYNMNSVSIKLDIYYNLDILNDSYIDTVRLAEYEPLLNNSSFDSLENYTKESKIDTDKIMTLENIEECGKGFKLDTITISRDWVKESNESSNYLVYNTSKNYIIKANDKLFKIGFTVEGYDRFNLHRLKRITVAGDNIDNCKKLAKAFLSVDELEFENLVQNEKLSISDNESMSLTKASEITDNFVWYLSYALYNR